MIPKIAHLCWFNKEVPTWLDLIMERHRQIHPHWKLKLHRETPQGWDLEDRVKECTMMCQLADLVYIWALCEEGGVVFDTDMLLMRCMDDLLEHDAFTSTHPPEANRHDTRLTNGLMGSIPHGPFTKFYEHLKQRTVSQGRAKFGPNGLTEFYHAGKLPLTLLPPHYFYPLRWTEKDLCKRLWESNEEQRQWILNEVSARYVDNVRPYTVHLWHTFDTPFVGING